MNFDAPHKKAIINLYSVSITLIEENMHLLSYYAKKTLAVWIIQEEEDSDLKEWIKQISEQSKIIEVLDHEDNELRAIKEAIVWFKTSSFENLVEVTAVTHRGSKPQLNLKSRGVDYRHSSELEFNIQNVVREEGK